MKNKNTHVYAGLLPQNFDKYNCVKIPWGFYLILAFIMRAYAVWVMSVTNMRDHVSFLQWVYPQQSLFYFSLFSGCIGWVIIFILAMRKPDSGKHLRWCWQKGRELIVFALAFDLFVSCFAFIYFGLLSVNLLLAQGIISAVCLGYLFTNKHMKIVFDEFPEEFDE